MDGIGTLIKRTREERGLTKRAAAKELGGISEMTLTMWEKGVWVPGPEREPVLTPFLRRPKQEILRMLLVLGENEKIVTERRLKAVGD